MVFVYSLASVLIISAISLVGVFTLSFSIEKIKKISLFLVAFSVGVLLGDAFFHLLPESFENFENKNAASLLAVLGIIIFFILEKFLRWRHCHNIGCKIHPRLIGKINLIGDFFHNFIDGALVAGSFLVSFSLGLSTSLAIIFHEIPQEIGDFGVLIHSGFQPKKALFLNFLSGLSAVLGALIVLFLGLNFENVSLFLLPLTAGGFIYIAGADLIPELHKTNTKKESFLQFLMILSGLLLMALLKFFG